MTDLLNGLTEKFSAFFSAIDFMDDPYVIALSVLIIITAIIGFIKVW